jgi:hypothetical protein
MAATEILARSFGISITPNAGVKTAIGGLDTFSLTESSNDADRTGFDDGGNPRHWVASRTRTIKLSGKFLEDPSNGTRDAGQEAVETQASLIGDLSLATWTIDSPGGNSLSFLGSVTMDEIGGGNDDSAKWGCTIKCSGQVTGSL